MVGAVGVFAEPRVLGGMVGGEIVGPEEPELTESKAGLEYEVLFKQVEG
jgi:hypothetical protein